MSEALANIARKKANLARVRAWADETRRGLLESEATAERELENVVAFMLSGKHTTLTAVARELNCSRKKVTAMAERARVRNMKLLRSGHDD